VTQTGTPSNNHYSQKQHLHATLVWTDSHERFLTRSWHLDPNWCLGDQHHVPHILLKQPETVIADVLGIK
jgi:hypothetical protein